MTRRGFTIVEMIIVLAIIGLAAAVSAPAFIDWSRDEASRAPADPLLGILESARRTSAQRGQRITVSIDPQTRLYRAWAGGDPADSVAAGTVELPPGARLVAQGGRARFDFDPLGGAWGAPVRITGAGAELVVQVDRWTGDARVVQ
jgi:prepilin-type N-terminal cleavage/methylation domain-containing protein